MLEGPLTVSRYVLMGKLASGGMGTVYRARLRGEGGFVRDFALKRLHPHFADDPEAVSMFLDEARLAALIRHPNVVTTIDMGREGSELFVVMALVDGASVAHLLEGGCPLPAPVAIRIAVDALAGLGAAHDVRDESGHPLELVHRDVSPANVLVGRDGQTLLTDFGIAKARARLRTTVGFELKGKLAYMAPEQMERVDVDARADVFAMGVVLWEMLRGERLLHGDRGRLRELEAETTPAWFPTGAGAAVDDVLVRALQRDPDHRFASAAAMAEALTVAAPSIASHGEVGRLVGERAPVGREEPIGHAPAAASSFGAAGDGDGTAAGLLDVAWGTRAQPEQVPPVAESAGRSSDAIPLRSHRRARMVALAAGVSVMAGGAWVATRPPSASRHAAPAVIGDPPSPATTLAPPLEAPAAETSSSAARLIIEGPPAAKTPSTPATRPAHPARTSPRRPTVRASGSATTVDTDPFGGRR